MENDKLKKSIEYVHSTIWDLMELMSKDKGTQGVKETAQFEMTLQDFKSLYYSMDRLNIIVGACHDVIKEIAAIDE